MKIPYIKGVGDEWQLKHEPLNPTGRWKIESCAYYENKLFIEHKGWIFNSWVSEDSIVWRPENKTTINECSINARK